MNENTSTSSSHTAEGNDTHEPQNITALRMLRFLLPLSDSAMGLADEEGLKKNRQVADSLLLWPPNLFAFTSEILSSTGAYYLVVSPAKDDDDHRKEIWPPEDYDVLQPDGKTINMWSDEVRRLGFKWRQNLNRKDRRFLLENLSPNKNFAAGELEQLLSELLPKEVLKCWETAAAGFDDKDIKDLLCLMEDHGKRSKHWKYFVCLMTLHAIADEACLGWGIREFVPECGETRTSDAQAFAEESLTRRGTLATIHEDRCRILPKRHTPNVGMTLRSISSNLALYHRSSMEVKWRRSVQSPLTHGKEKIKLLNVLLIPWPYKIYARDFQELEEVPFQANSEAEGFFEYLPFWNSNDALKDEDYFIKHGLADILEDAKKETGRVDLVILPELALSQKNIDSFERKLEEAGVSGYIAGVRYDREKSGNSRFNRNMVYCKFSQLDREQYEFPKDAEEYIQQKHHRWKLDEMQIIKYQLGGSLSPNKVWWEGIKLSRRKVTFINVGEEITICPLICEDLARQEPISDLIRAVGPTLVVAILMDGPQKMSRWSAGYSSVLADDPRSSVLTFTCLGMVEKMQVRGVPKSKAVALWKDPLNAPQEIELEDGKRGIVLNLIVKQKKEITADGRKEEVATPYLTLGGTIYI